MSVKNIFQHYHDHKLQQQSVDVDLERTLAQHLFKQSVQSRPKTRLHSSLLSWRWLIGGGVMSLALLVIALWTRGQWFNTTPLATPVLAQILANTFGQENFTSSFSLGNPDVFLHRTFTVRYYPIELRNQTQPIDPKLLPTYVINLWGYQGNVRKDVQNLTNLKHKRPKQYAHSILLSDFENRACYTKNKKPFYQCKQRSHKIDLLAASIKKSYYTTTSVSPIVQIQSEKFYDELDGPSLKIEWATAEPIEGGRLVSYTYPEPVSVSYLDDYEDHHSTQPNWHYINEYRDGLYWHARSIRLYLTNTDGTAYVQIKTKAGTSAIYQYSVATQTLNELSPADFNRQLHAYYKSFQVIDGVYESTLRPALYMMKYPAEFTTPIAIEENVTKNNVSTQRERFVISEQMHTDLVWGWVSDFSLSTSKYIDIWYSPDTQRIIAYSLLDAANQPLLEVGINDVAVRDIAPEEFFTLDYWVENKKILFQ